MIIGRFPLLSETFIFRKAVKLAERGHAVTVFTRDDGQWDYFKEYLPLPATLHVQVLLPDTRLTDPRRALRLVGGMLAAIVRDPAAAWRFWHILQTVADRNERLRAFIGHLPFLKQRADILHFEFLGLSASYPHAARMTGARQALSCRGADLHLMSQNSAAVQAILIEQMRTVGAIHVVAQEMADEAARISGRTSGIWVNRPAVDTDAIRPPAAPRDHAVPQIIAVGRLVWKKAFDYLLAALARLKAKNIPFHAQIIGGGELFAELRFSIWDLGLTDSVDLVGGIAPPLVLERMQHADMLVLSSHEEGISNAVLEGMASGLPIVTTNAGGMAEAITDGVEGFLIPVRDIEALADRIERLLTDPALRARMGQTARARAVAEFSLTRQAEVFETMYGTLLEGTTDDR